MSRARVSRRPLRIVTYNILLGGARREEHITAVLRSHLETVISTAGTQVPELHLHSVHLAARFGERRKGEERRRRELDALLSDLTETADAPHLIAGDFNSLAP